MWSGDVDADEVEKRWVVRKTKRGAEKAWPVDRHIKKKKIIGVRNAKGGKGKGGG